MKHPIDCSPPLTVSYNADSDLSQALLRENPPVPGLAVRRGGYPSSGPGAATSSSENLIPSAPLDSQRRGGDSRTTAAHAAGLVEAATIPALTTEALHKCDITPLIAGDHASLSPAPLALPELETELLVPSPPHFDKSASLADGPLRRRLRRRRAPLPPPLLYASEAAMVGALCDSPLRWRALLPLHAAVVGNAAQLPPLLSRYGLPRASIATLNASLASLVSAHGVTPPITMSHAARFHSTPAACCDVIPTVFGCSTLDGVRAGLMAAGVTLLLLFCLLGPWRDLSVWDNSALMVAGLGVVAVLLCAIEFGRCIHWATVGCKTTPVRGRATAVAAMHAAPQIQGVIALYTPELLAANLVVDVVVVALRAPYCRASKAPRREDEGAPSSLSASSDAHDAGGGTGSDAVLPLQAVVVLTSVLPDAPSQPSSFRNGGGDSEVTPVVLPYSVTGTLAAAPGTPPPSSVDLRIFTGAAHEQHQPQPPNSIAQDSPHLLAGGPTLTRTLPQPSPPPPRSIDVDLECDECGLWLYVRENGGASLLPPPPPLPALGRTQLQALLMLPVKLIFIVAAALCAFSLCTMLVLVLTAIMLYAPFAMAYLPLALVLLACGMRAFVYYSPATVVYAAVPECSHSCKVVGAVLVILLHVMVYLSTIAPAVRDEGYIS